MKYFFYKTALTFSLLSILLNGCNHTVKKENTPIAASSKLPLVAACHDPSGKYIAVKAINSRTNYLDKASSYSPIQSKAGFIKTDFNQDRKVDAIFIERQLQKGKYTKIRLVICESNRYGYQRKYPPFPIYESDLPDYQANSQRVEMRGNHLVLSDFRHEHNWGSDSTINTYRYNKALKGFELIRRETNSSSGDGLRSDTEESYFLTTARYISKSTCGSYDDACKSHSSVGRIIPSDTKPTLFNKGKIYKRLIPD